MRVLTLLVALAVQFALTGAAVAAVGVVDWEYSFVNMRTAPSTGAKKILRIPEGTEVKIVEDKGEWLLIGYAAKQGWVVSRSIQLLKPATLPATVEEESVAAPQLQSASSAVSGTAIQPPVAPQPPQPPVMSEAVAKPAGASAQAPVKAAVQADAPAGSPASADEGGEPALNLGASFISIFAWLLVGLTVLGALVWLVKRFLSEQATEEMPEEGSVIRILTSKSLDSRQSLLLAEVGGEVYLLAKSEGGVDLVTKIESPEALDQLDGLLEFRSTPSGKTLKQKVDLGDAGSADDEGVSAEDRLQMLRRRPRAPEDN